ncbi:MAG: metal-sulfur cluster assembly factor [Acidimicrobiia bacterium]|nr:metal-sulfur cluster assembly factor [Acidimicrobiia bacterium]
MNPVEVNPVDVNPVEVARHALRGVLDPELGVDIVALGLVYDVRVDGDTLVVDMTLTTPGCPVSQSLPGQARAAVAAVLGDMPVDVRIVWDPPWTPDYVEPEARRQLGLR